MHTERTEGDAAGTMKQLVRAEGGGEEEGLIRGGAENRTGTVVQEHKTIKFRHTHGKQNGKMVWWLGMLTANSKVPGKSWSFSEGLALDRQSNLVKDKPCLE
jgi:hypothetical protein